MKQRKLWRASRQAIECLQLSALSMAGRTPRPLELETLFNVMLYTLSGGGLVWQGKAEKHPFLMTTMRRGAMIEEVFERVMLKRIDRACWPALQRLRAVFFPNGGSSYRTNVSCQDFLDAL